MGRRTELRGRRQCSVRDTLAMHTHIHTPLLLTRDTLYLVFLFFFAGGGANLKLQSDHTVFDKS